MSEKNAYFQLYIKNGAGIALIIYPPSDGGKELSFDEVDEYLKNKKIEYQKKLVSDTLKVKNERKQIVISRLAHLAEAESIKLHISSDGMEVKARFYPPSLGEAGERLSKKDIMSELEMHGITCGICEESIDSFIKNPLYCTDYIVAKAIPAIEGKNASIEYYFNTNLSGRPKLNQDGSVDFHSLNNISPVGKGQLIAKLIPEVNGTAGKDVFGRLLQPAAVTSKKLSFGKNIRISDNKQELYSEVDGHAQLIEGQVFVTDNYEVPEDVDASTGDIKYSGNIIIKGNVRTGYKVICDGDIIVNGVVEGAYLEAKGQIILKRGIQGMNKGVIKSKKSVVSKFIERAEVYADGYVQAEAILHSKVVASNDVIVGGKKGFISGGEIISSTTISAKIAGSEMGTSTVLEVGIDPGLVEEMKTIEKSIPKLRQESEKLEQVTSVFAKKIKSGEKLDAERLIQMKQIVTDKKNIDKEISEYEARYEELSESIEGSSNGCIKIQDVIYPGCKVVISGCVMYVRSNIQHSRLIKEGDDVRIVAY